MKTLVLCLLLAAGALASPSSNVKRHATGNVKIVGGNDTMPGEFPYMLEFLDLAYGPGFLLCGAVIYNENWAITGGQCVYGQDLENPQYLRVVAGEHDVTVDEGTEQTVALKRIILHENYNGFYLYNDIALLELAEPLEFNAYVSTIALPEQDQQSSGDCVATGFGTLSEGGYYASILQKVTLPIVSDEECRAVYGEDTVQDNMLCAGVKEGGKDACAADAGGPLACENEGSRYLAGLVSWGTGCARPNFPGVYTEISYFVDWIKENAV
ncbi:trypsin-1-like [Homarus americanus]|uniref:trypsin-1-like n=1 Tax=Homarus americanus TaxID=6706 RepID=UPI001C488F2C|nr:trypsin-1-like [Homarus americanus]